MTPSRKIENLLEIMRRLRDPDSGCPWDLEQSYATLKNHTIEEAYEVADAIEREDFDDLKTELGDLLFQAVYYTQLAVEESRFDFGDIVYAISEKLIRRHPHVFTSNTSRNLSEVNSSWESTKAAERAVKSMNSGTGAAPSVLDDVPRALPALVRANKLAKRAARVGFDWPDTGQALQKVREEVTETEIALQSANASTERLAEEIGDLLFATASVARKSGIDAEEALNMANAKFIRRFRHVEKRCTEDELPLEEASLAQLEAYWEEIRQRDKSGDPT